MKKNLINIISITILITLTFIIIRIESSPSSLDNPVIYKTEDCLIYKSDMQTYESLYFSEYNKNLNNFLQLTSALYCKNNTQSIIPLKVVISCNNYNIDIEYGGYLLAILENDKIIQFIPNSVCGNFINTESKLWTFNEYFNSIFLLDNFTVSFAIRGNLQVNWNENILASKSVFTDCYQLKIP